MSTIVADPSVLTKDRLKSDLQSHNIPLPSGDARKDAYVKLYLKHLTPLIAKKHRDSPKRSEFSSDEESTPRVRGERKKTTKKSSSSRVISRDDIEIEKDVANLSDTELASALQELGATIGPITATTRSVYERKLIKLRSGQTQIEQDEESDDYSDSDEDVPNVVQLMLKAQHDCKEWIFFVEQSPVHVYDEFNYNCYIGRAQKVGGYNGRALNRGGYIGRALGRGGYIDRDLNRGGYIGRAQKVGGYIGRAQKVGGYIGRAQKVGGYIGRAQKVGGYIGRAQKVDCYIGRAQKVVVILAELRK
uniref:Lamina-associated polypeptide 2, isoforms beta/delta/epsilon/gamma-like n=1 Tax=Saccoglossus kowalevskii TaxID=10224 RepID=A0ABM0MRT5_SACKO|nr:PREDICTED: lamina-associated polypeptide 2, isoforms beta/delta/epsilon/gamma-like [Saccoglossus kowalevskii]